MKSDKEKPYACDFRLLPRKNIHQEYVVRAYDQYGKKYPAADYFTDDKEDALGTMRIMKLQALKHKGKI